MDNKTKITSAATIESLKQEIGSLKRLVKQYESERRLTALELHDGLVQEITAALMHVQAMIGRQDLSEQELNQSLEMVRSLLEGSIAEARSLLSGLRPPLIEQGGVVSAISSLIEEKQLISGPAIEFEHDVNFLRLPPILETSIYRIVQEALNNALRHSKSDRIRIELQQTGDGLSMEVSDWGIGFDQNQVSKQRFGLQGMKERAKSIHGELSINSKPDSGTQIILELPIPTTSE